ncbi:MAG: TetR/AcrR family transcriptional regulator [Acidimicrobiales bacterium]
MTNTEERLLDAADDLMRARGYEAVGLAEICRVADARKGSFYHYFGSKEVLAIAMLDRAWRRRRDTTFEAAFSDRTRPVVERFTVYAEAMAEDLRRNGIEAIGVVPGCRFGNFAAEISSSHPAIRAKLVEVLDEMKLWFANALRDGVESGELRSDIDIEREAGRVLAQMEGLMLLARAHEDPDTILVLPDSVSALRRT